jgi:hypothetical protein
MIAVPEPELRRIRPIAKLQQIGLVWDHAVLAPSRTIVFVRLCPAVSLFRHVGISDPGPQRWLYTYTVLCSVCRVERVRHLGGENRVRAERQRVTLVPRETDHRRRSSAQDANGRVVERYIVRRHDQDGNPGPAGEAVVIEEKKSGNTVVTVNALVYRGDINGNLQPRRANHQPDRSPKAQVTTTQTTTRTHRPRRQCSLPAEKVQSTDDPSRARPRQLQTVTKLYRDASGNYYEGIEATPSDTQTSTRRAGGREPRAVCGRPS